jgi:antagonist of KipI
VKSIQVLAPGMLTTVQDLGREGYGPMGVSASGAADPLALRIGNRLVANPENAPALEMTLLGGTFLFPEGAVVALAGSDFGATLDAQPIATWTSVEVGAGQTLRLGGTKTGARCYLCVQGGIDVPLMLGSASTHLLSGLGGLQGRALCKGDTLRIAAAPRGFHKKTVAENAMEHLAVRKILRVTPGPQSDWFDQTARRTFYGAAYRVGEQSNRMGLRLEGPSIPTDSAGEMLSEGVALGAIQITAGGLPIILFVEQQTTGGYPKIANVISADLPSLGQLRPRDEIRFEQVEITTALGILREQQEWLASEKLFV